MRLLITVLILSGVLCGRPDDVPASSNPGTRRFLVVAPERFYPELTGYVRHKQGQLPTSLVPLERVLKQTTGKDDPERLKRYLYDVWRKDGTAYALLVGDADVLPVRYMVLDRITPAAFDYAFYPSDLYYSDLAKADGAFDDWNARKDSFHGDYYGEVRGEKNKKDPINFDQVDYRPDIAVGRWPASTPEEVRTIAAKTMAYETAVAAGRAPGLRRAAFLSVSGWIDSRGMMDSMAEKMPPGWSIEKRYYADGRRNDRTPPPDEAQVRTLLNEGIGLLLHAGHGQDDAWEQCFYLSRLDRVKNADRLPVILSAGCSTARFATLPPYEAYRDIHGQEHEGTNNKEVFSAPPPPPAVYQTGRYNPSGLGEQLLRRGPDGAVAYIGCNTGSQPCGLTLLDGFANALGRTRSPRLGDCWSEAVAYYYEKERLASIVPTDDWYPASIFFQGMKFMLFGDPTLRMPPPQREE
jgi:peptidase C25-like protein